MEILVVGRASGLRDQGKSMASEKPSRMAEQRDPSSLGRYIEALFKFLDVQQSEIAELADVSDGYLTMIIRPQYPAPGQRGRGVQPSTDVIDKLVQAFKMCAKDKGKEQDMPPFWEFGFRLAAQIGSLPDPFFANLTGYLMSDEEIAFCNLIGESLREACEINKRKRPQ